MVFGDGSGSTEDGYGKNRKSGTALAPSYPARADSPWDRLRQRQTQTQVKRTEELVKKLVITFGALLLFIAQPVAGQTEATWTPEQLPYAPADPADVYYGGTYQSFTEYINGKGVYVGPYKGTVETSMGDMFPASLYCVDFVHEVSNGDSWSAYSTPITSSANFENTYQFGIGTFDLYRKTAFLASLFRVVGTTDDAWSSLHGAIWSLTNEVSGYDPDSYFKEYEDEWEAFDASNWYVLSDANGVKQEFLVERVPEPATIILLLTGFMAIVVLARQRSRQGQYL